ncbi:MAG: RNA methyltransferase [Candidatus Amoebophilus sp. 36-38]|nr:MAG: RNA methyltransferase [Candidatus Amoebophilus sp. 36-38]
MSHFQVYKNLSNATIKFIKSLRLKKYRLQENSFVLEGEKNVTQLLTADYHIKMVVCTTPFFNLHTHLLAKQEIEVFQVDEKTLSSLGTFQANNAALAVATIPSNKPFELSKRPYSLVLDDINDPGNLGTIIRIADWYNMGGIICSSHTVELYNPKVLHASMGSFMRVNVYYTDLSAYLAQTELPVIGAFTNGQNIHDPQTTWPSTGLIVIGNEAHGISQQLIPYIHQKISIPRYGHAESLNAAVATAVICDNFSRVISRGINFIQK